MKYQQSMRDAYNQVIEEQSIDFDELVEELDIENRDDLEQLDESRFLRGASALLFASKSKQSGNKVVQYANRGKTILNRFKRDMTTDERVELLQNAMMKMFDAVIENRKQIGNLVGIATASALISERSTKQLTKLIKTSLRGK